jgi:hypothetical protein
VRQGKTLRKIAQGNSFFVCALLRNPLARVWKRGCIIEAGIFGWGHKPPGGKSLFEGESLFFQFRGD